MRKVKEIYYLEPEERKSEYSKGIKFVFEDDSILEQMTTDVVADDFIPKCVVCGEMGHSQCDNFPV